MGHKQALPKGAVEFTRAKRLARSVKSDNDRRLYECFNIIAKMNSEKNRFQTSLIAAGCLLENGQFDAVYNLADKTGIDFGILPIVYYALKRNNFYEMERALERDKRQIDARPMAVRALKFSDTPLSLVVRTGQVTDNDFKKLKLCFANHANACLPSETSGKIPLMALLERGYSLNVNFLEMLLEYDPRQLQYRDDNGFFPINHYIEVFMKSALNPHVLNALVRYGAFEPLQKLQQEGLEYVDPAKQCEEMWKKGPVNPALLSWDLIENGWMPSDAFFENSALLKTNAEKKLPQSLIIVFKLWREIQQGQDSYIDYSQLMKIVRNTFLGLDEELKSRILTFLENSEIAQMHEANGINIGDFQLDL